ncbi:ABC transporter permease [Salinibacterium sp. SWN139]|uniref:ABC transporter permease n=1 Tax=Salinibacterium sp. SWN139 TaxID=2792055 RepID=UPI0018CE2A04|nr:ABC transporter permease [Salinibacterium sp. SWN139]MBH0055292.1 ABC transporter permease [Salinibacterium sp. SWN139]
MSWWRKKKPADSPAEPVETPSEPAEPPIEPAGPSAGPAASAELVARPNSELAVIRQEPRGAVVSGVVGAVVEAWDEVRINRTRVLLSLIGIGVAVCALATVVGAGTVFGQAQTEQFERGSGRPATLAVYPPYQASGTQNPDTSTFVASMESIIERYQISHATPLLRGSITANLVNGTQFTAVQGVSAAYGVMHRVELGEGRWLTEEDGNRLATAVVINDEFYDALGRPDLRTHPTIELEGESTTTAVVVGVFLPEPFSTGLTLSMLEEPFRALLGSSVGQQSDVSYELWVPEEQSAQLQDIITRDMAGDFGEGWTANVTRNDYLAWGGPSPLEPLQWVIGGIAGLILLLGGLGLVNISLVTVKYRVREIGVRRAFGATAGRVFFAVMMESVVATVAAGVIGVALAIVIVQNPSVQGLIAPGVQDLPPFPLEAALIALAASAAVGALAGLMPALVAVRVKVIDAIRY